MLPGAQRFLKSAINRSAAMRGALSAPLTLPGSVVRNFLLLMAGSGLGHLVVFAVTPLLTRLLTPDDLGLYGAFATLVAVLTIFSALGFETAIIGARNDHALVLLGLCVVVSTLTVVIVIAALVLIDLEPFALFPDWLLVLVGVNCLFAAGFTAAQYWYVREARYETASLGMLAMNAGRGLASLGCAATAPGAAALPLGDAVGRLVGLVLLDRRGVLARAVMAALAAPRAALGVAREYWKSALFVMPSAVLEVVVFWLPVFLTTVYFSLADAGQVALIQRVLAAPLALIGKNLADVYQVGIIRANGAVSAGIVLITGAIVAVILAAAALATVVLFWWGPGLFAVVFGRSWEAAGVLAPWLLPLAAFQLSGAIVTRLLIEARRQELKLYAYLALLAGTVAAFHGAELWQLSLTETIAALSLIGCTIYLVWLGSSLLICRRQVDA